MAIYDIHAKWTTPSPSPSLCLGTFGVISRRFYRSCTNLFCVRMHYTPIGLNHFVMQPASLALKFFDLLELCNEIIKARSWFMHSAHNLDSFYPCKRVQWVSQETELGIDLIIRFSYFKNCQLNHSYILPKASDFPSTFDQIKLLYHLDYSVFDFPIEYLNIVDETTYVY